MRIEPRRVGLNEDRGEAFGRSGRKYFLIRSERLKLVHQKQPLRRGQRLVIIVGDRGEPADDGGNARIGRLQQLQRQQQLVAGNEPSPGIEAAGRRFRTEMLLDGADRRLLFSALNQAADFSLRGAGGQRRCRRCCHQPRVRARSLLPPRAARLERARRLPLRILRIGLV